MLKPIATVAALVLASLAHAQLTTFTFQGDLRDGGAPATGLFDLRFRLFDSASGGLQQGPTLCADNVSVEAGRVSVTLDFGAQFFGAERFLEAQVRQDTGLACTDSTGFIILTPRQAVTPVPLAQHANSAVALDAPDGSPLNAVFVANDGRVGIGTLAPQAPLHISTGNVEPAPGEGIRITGTAPGNPNVSYISFATTAGQAVGYVGDGSTTDSDMYLTSYLGDVFVYTPWGPVISATSAGSVGIGTTNPAAKLDVRGDVKLGPSGQYYAAKSNHSDRILRGLVSSSGVLPASTGCTVVHSPSSGFYAVHFNTPYAAAPTVVATPTANDRHVHVFAATAASMSIYCTDDAGAIHDGAFHFIVIGE